MASRERELRDVVEAHGTIAQRAADDLRPHACDPTAMVTNIVAARAGRVVPVEAINVVAELLGRRSSPADLQARVQRMVTTALTQDEWPRVVRLRFERASGFGRRRMSIAGLARTLAFGQSSTCGQHLPGCTRQK